MMAIFAGLMLLSAVIVWACARASNEADAHAMRLFEARKQPREEDYNVEADMIREAMEEEHW